MSLVPRPLRTCPRNRRLLRHAAERHPRGDTTLALSRVLQGLGYDIRMRDELVRVHARTDL